jgi:hypothetical protein
MIEVQNQVQIKPEVGNSTKPLLADSRSSDFNQWLYLACEIKAGKLKEAHDIFPYVDLTDAKLAFIDGMTELEYSKHISTM